MNKDKIFKWNGLARKTPLRAKKGFKRKLPKWKKRKAAESMRQKGRLRYMSPKREIRMRAYWKLRNEFLKLNPFCKICEARFGKRVPAVEVHHRDGRIGPMLLAVETFIASCRGCREWPHQNPVEAARLGFMPQNILVMKNLVDGISSKG